MNKNTLIGFVLIAVVLVGFSWYSQPSQEEMRAQFVKDSLEQVAKQKAGQAAKIAAYKQQQAAKEQVANMIFARLGIEAGELPLDASDALAIAWTHANPAPLLSNLSVALPADCTKKQISSRKKKPTVKQWENLIQKMGGKLP